MRASLVLSLVVLCSVACDDASPGSSPAGSSQAGGSSGAGRSGGGEAGVPGAAGASGSSDAGAPAGGQGGAGQGGAGQAGAGQVAGQGGAGQVAGQGGAGQGGVGVGGAAAGAAGGGSGGGAGAGPGPEWGAERCGEPAAEVGYEVGEVLGPLVVKDCETGAEATLDEVCGASATWVFVAHTHCPTCQATASFTDTVAAEVASQGVAVVHIVHDDNGTSCAQWKAAYKLGGLPNVRLYEDPTGQVWEKLKTSNYTAPSAFLDRHRVVTHRAHGLSQSKVLAAIDEALAK